MITVFVSYAPSDVDLAVEVAEALRRAGIDAPRVVPAQTAWGDALAAAAVECRVVVALVTARWLAPETSGLDDLVAAAERGKRIVALVMVDEAALPPAARPRLTYLRAEGWVVAEAPERAPLRDASTREAMLDAVRGAGGDSARGLDPSVFAVDRTRRPAPYAGLAPFEDDDADAAVFFGRGRELAEVLETLRSHRAAQRYPAVAIVGAAGVGKTSLMLAGVMPRLRREAPAWLVARPVRFDTDPVFALADALCGTLADFGATGDTQRLTDALAALWSTSRDADGRLTDVGRKSLAARLGAEAERLRAAAGRPRATLLLGVDGADALVDGDDGARAALAYLAAASDLADVQLVLTAEGSAFEALRAAELEAVPFVPYALRPLPAFRFDEVIAGPAARYDTTVAPSWIDALVTEASAPDELPLLAWGLRQLWSEGALEQAPPPGGGLAARVEAVADAAMGQATDAVAARTFVPALLRLDDQGAVCAPEAAWADVPPYGQALLERFVRAGLVRREGETVAVTPLSLLRRWPRLTRWLAPDRARLSARRALRHAADAWHQGGRRDADLRHTRARLVEARDSARPESLLHFEEDYLRACQARDRAATRWRWAGRLAVASALAVATFAILRWGPALRSDRPPPSPFEPTALSTRQEAALVPGDTFTECKTGCPKMVVVPAGSFVMGDERGKDAVALPRHRVTIARPFAVGQTEVTIEEMGGVCGADAACVAAALPGDIDPRKPFAYASWLRAQIYVQRLSGMTGRRYRLLSEAEWEYVARATSTTAYPWGEDIGQGRAHCGECGVPLEAHYFEFHGGTYVNEGAPVGSYPPNAFGLYDTHGNQWEIVEDCWHASYAGAPVDGSPWKHSGGGDCELAVIRGGSMHGAADRVRSMVRDFVRRATDTPILGFRVARDLGEPARRPGATPWPLSARDEAALLPGDTFTECSAGCPEMVVVPAGRFVMGDEREQASRALPRHTVLIARPFAVGRTEVTVAQVLAACRWSLACPADVVRSMTETVEQGGGRQPAVGWGPHADGFVHWLSWTTGKRYRLLTEAEWEYVARAQTGTAYAWGEDIGDGRARCRACGVASGLNGEDARLVRGGPVAAFAPNAFGVYDMHGNVWERVQDCWHETYEGAPYDGSAWMDAGGGDCDRVVLRGGGMLDPADQLRSSARDWTARTEMDARSGIRVARDLDLTQDPRRAPQRLEAAALTPEEERDLLPTDTFTECDRGCPEMIVVPSGSFVMGDEREEEPTALPRRRVTIARPFAVGRTEVTNRQVAFMCSVRGDCEAEPSGPGRAPAHYVSREGARDYAAWLSEVTGRSYRLLSEAEWEYVTRAGSETAYTWGDEFRDGRAFCEKCGLPIDIQAYFRDGIRHGHPVASFLPNAFGLFDVHGNVWELVDDCWHESYVGAPADGSSWRAASGGQCDLAVLRGGGMAARPERLRSALREYTNHRATTDIVGFRVARDISAVEGVTAAPPGEGDLRAELFAPFALSAAAESSLHPGDVFRECKAGCPSMVVVPAGAFIMGDERDEDDSARPRHRVVIDRPFAVGRTEVTIAQGALCARAGGCPEIPYSRRIDGRKPYNFVSWDGAQAYVQWLSRMTGARYRLLSESEWAYMARAGSQTRYAWGDDIGVARAHCQGCGGAFESHVLDGGGYTNDGAPVGSFAPNDFGVFDVHGNIWELVQDCWHATYAGAPTDGSAWMAADGGDCSRAVIRGGGPFGSAERLRSMVRDAIGRAVNRPNIGFRVARDLTRRDGPVRRITVPGPQKKSEER